MPTIPTATTPADPWFPHAPPATARPAGPEALAAARPAVSLAPATARPAGLPAPAAAAPALPVSGAAAGRGARRRLVSQRSADLAVAAQRGDVDAAGELYRRTHGPARRAARVYCRDADADDAVAEGLLRALCRLGQLREPAAVEAWMVRCAVRAAVDLSRRRARLRSTADVDALAERALPAIESAADVALSTLDRRSMAAAIQELPPGPRQVIHLRYQAGLSVSDIARMLGRPAGTVRRQCVEARQAAGQRFLRRQLAEPAGTCAEVCDWLCQDVCRRLRQPLDPKSSTRAGRLVDDHLRVCVSCRDRKAELAALAAELGRRQR